MIRTVLIEHAASQFAWQLRFTLGVDQVSPDDLVTVFDQIAMEGGIRQQGSMV